MANTRLRNVCGIALIAAAITMTGACAVPSTTTDAPAAGQAKSGPKTTGLGKSAKDGKFTFTVTKVKNGPKRIGDQYVGTTPQGKFVFVYVTVVNHGNEAQGFSGDDQKLLAGGKEYSADSEAAVYLEDAKSLFEEINPGNKVKGIIVYDIPKSVTPTAIELHDSAFSGGVKVALR
ncbi:MAG TPA: DUF4352 domain-containing protein [Streptosporangiaceae bacterium]|jgi:hypothetical protein